jgi:hypothetical protein
MSSITGDVNELNDLNIEIKRLGQQLRQLRQKAKAAENRIVEFLKEKDQVGVRYQGKAIVIENKPKRAPKKKTDREADVIKVLQDYNIPNPDVALKEILNSYQGNVIEAPKLKIKKL